MSRKPVKFRDDIEPENTWVISDTHFGHSNIVDFCHRPTHHESVMIEEWAREVPEEATVLHLGDLNYSHNAMFKNVHSKHLPGARKLLIQGNHDHQRFSF
jgi:calcineurin-like phosphoesterase family protein